MQRLQTILRTFYEINCLQLSPLQGGWAALAYKVVDHKSRYFLKVYEKSRASTAKWTAHIDDYVPILLWLKEQTALRHNIPVPILTKDGAYQCEDEEGIYLLYEYIEGETIGERNLTQAQMIQLSKILAELHKYTASDLVNADKLQEDFDVAFLQSLRDILHLPACSLPDDIKTIIRPVSKHLDRMIEQTSMLSSALKNEKRKMSLCHMDIHHWNLMQTDQHLILIDWEGLKLAPVEADIMSLLNKPYYMDFLHVYQSVHKDFSIHPDALQFYQYRRKLEDVWEFTEQLLYDHQPKQEREATLRALGNELDEFIID